MKLVFINKFASTKNGNEWIQTTGNPGMPTKLSSKR